MEHDTSIKVVGQILSKIGYTVDLIPEGLDESADLWAHAGDDQLVVEVKSRVDNLDVAEELDRSPNEVVTREGPLVRSDAFGRTVRKATFQIVASQRLYSGIALLWFRETPAIEPSDAAHRMMANLLGVRDVSFRRGQDFGFGRAFLAARTDFHRYPHLDAAVVEDNEGFRLLVNPFSPRPDEVRRTLLYKYCAGFNAVLDLDQLESTEEHFLVRSDIDRTDEAAVLEHLNKQHPGYRFMFADLQSLKGFVRVPWPRSEGPE